MQRALLAPGTKEISKAWARYALVSAGLASLIVGIGFITWPWPYLWTVENVILPRYEKSFGFRGGRVQACEGSEDTTYAIVEVDPKGPLGRAGVRSGDIPVQFPHGGGPIFFYAAMRDVEDGAEGEFARRFNVLSDLKLCLAMGQSRSITLGRKEEAQ